MVLPVADANSGDAKSMGRIGQTWDLSVWNHIYAAGRAVQVHRVNVMSMITVRFPNSSKAHWMERAGCGNMGEEPGEMESLSPRRLLYFGFSSGYVRPRLISSLGRQ